jgi:predicted RNA binding protein YcfA (HicA-like mRNA interferase family)
VVKVRDVIRRLEADGWFLWETEGSHRQFKHGSKPGKVTVAGKMSEDLHPKTLKSIYRQAGWEG